MKITIKHFGHVKNGKKFYENLDLYREQIQALEGKNFVEEIKERKVSASMSQYGYYRGAILSTCHKSEMFSYFENKDSIHENYFAPKFLSYKVLVKLPEKTYEQLKVRSLADLSVDEMKEFIERVLADCAENGILIPDPESYYNKYYQK